MDEGDVLEKGSGTQAANGREMGGVEEEEGQWVQGRL